MPLHAILEIIQPLPSQLDLFHRILQDRSFSKQSKMLLGFLDLTQYRSIQSMMLLHQPAHQFTGIGQDPFGRFRRSQGSDVGGQVGQGDVDFVADSRNGWNRTIRDRSHHPLLIEAPQILHGTSTASDHQNVERWFDALR
jgi:hypothetical protein